MLTPESIRKAYQNAIPARREQFVQTEAKCRDDASHVTLYQQHYLQELLRLAKQELRLRLEMAAGRVRSLVDSGWRPDEMESVRSVYIGMFGLYDHYEKESFRDLYGYIETAFETIGYAPKPGEHAQYVKSLSEAQVRYSEEFLSDAECYMDSKQSEKHEKTAMNFHGNVNIGALQTGDSANATVTQHMGADLSKVVEAILALQTAARQSQEPQSEEILAVITDALAHSKQPDATATSLGQIVGRVSSLIQTTGAVPATWNMVAAAFMLAGVHLPTLPQ